MRSQLSAPRDGRRGRTVPSLSSVSVGASVRHCSDTTLNLSSSFVIADIPVQTVSGGSSIDVTINASDPDGQAVTLSVQSAPSDAVQQTAYDLMQTHSFYSASSDFYNYRGLGEKYVRGNGLGWFYVVFVQVLQY